MNAAEALSAFFTVLLGGPLPPDSAAASLGVNAAVAVNTRKDPAALIALRDLVNAEVAAPTWADRFTVTQVPHGSLAGDIDNAKREADIRAMATADSLDTWNAWRLVRNHVPWLLDRLEAERMARLAAEHACNLMRISAAMTGVSVARCPTMRNTEQHGEERCSRVVHGDNDHTFLGDAA